MAIWFSSKSPDYNWLSNFSEQAFELDGARWKSVEVYYQSMKYEGTPAADLFRQAPSAGEARKIGKNRGLEVRADWEDIKEAVMREALMAKFTQNRKLKEMLVATGTEELIHQSGTDFHWGRHLEGHGLNRLGILLMEVRENLKALATGKK